jgi:hypothetical protein
MGPLAVVHAANYRRKKSSHEITATKMAAQKASTAQSA